MKKNVILMFSIEGKTYVAYKDCNDKVVLKYIPNSQVAEAYRYYEQKKDRELVAVTKDKVPDYIKDMVKEQEALVPVEPGEIIPTTPTKVIVDTVENKRINKKKFSWHTIVIAVLVAAGIVHAGVSISKCANDEKNDNTSSTTSSSSDPSNKNEIDSNEIQEETFENLEAFLLQYNRIAEKVESKFVDQEGTLHLTFEEGMALYIYANEMTISDIANLLEGYQLVLNEKDYNNALLKVSKTMANTTDKINFDTLFNDANIDSKSWLANALDQLDFVGYNKSLQEGDYENASKYVNSIETFIKSFYGASSSVNDGTLKLAWVIGNAQINSMILNNIEISQEIKDEFAMLDSNLNLCGASKEYFESVYQEALKLDITKTDNFEERKKELEQNINEEDYSILAVLQVEPGIQYYVIEDHQVNDYNQTSTVSRGQTTSSQVTNEKTETHKSEQTFTETSESEEKVTRDEATDAFGSDAVEKGEEQADKDAGISDDEELPDNVVENPDGSHTGYFDDSDGDGIEEELPVDENDDPILPPIPEDEVVIDIPVDGPVYDGDGNIVNNANASVYDDSNSKSSDSGKRRSPVTRDELLRTLKYFKSTAETLQSTVAGKVLIK